MRKTFSSSGLKSCSCQVSTSKARARVVSPDARSELAIAMAPVALAGGWVRNQSSLAASLKGRRTPIKAALLDQKVVAGLGNIYVCEALFSAGLSPRRQAYTVQGSRAERLAWAVRDGTEALVDTSCEHFTGDRELVRESTVAYAIQGMRERLT